MSSSAALIAELPPRQSNAANSVSRAVFKWPDAACSRATAVYGSGIFALWLMIYGGANWITGLHGYRISLRIGFDLKFPFLSATAIVYLSLFPMFWLSPFVLRAPARLRAFARALAIVIVISGIGFVLVPAEPIELGSVATDASGKLFQFADWLNLTHNYFPSLHVGMAVLCAASYCRFAPWSAGILFSLWAAAIALSTLFLRQHYIADVLAGGALGLLLAAYQRRSSC
jgi:membrane-associated phospholipid phosphatase